MKNLLLKEFQNTCSHIKTTKQIRIPKLSDLELIALSLTAEYTSINTKLQLFRHLKGTILDDKIERSVYNKRGRMLFNYLEKIRHVLSDHQDLPMFLSWILPQSKFVK